MSQGIKGYEFLEDIQEELFSESHKDELLKAAGFEQEVEAKKQGKCPFCKKQVDPDKEFEDDKEGKKEFEISGLCKDCQKKIFG